ncbi:hypothetical protein [Streptomyces sp. NPDC093589]|uniref:hypothetical protein n=1 Tax=Streptomyces sp. NPDC093589 TaxID=3366043 RepID=UPI00382B46F7
MGAGVLLVSGLMSGCSAPWSSPEPTMQVGQAVKRVDAVLDETFRAVQPRLKWREGPAAMSEQRNSVSNTANGVVTVGRTRYVRTEVSKDKLARLAKAVEKHWKGEGYEIGDMNPKGPSFSGTASDGCRITFSVGGSGIVYFDAGISAVSPGHGGEIKGEEGDEFAQDPQGGGPDHRPDVRDPYWSK